MAKTSPSRIAALLDRVRISTAARGKKAELARFLGFPPQRVNDWLSERFTPSGEVTLQLLEWVQAEEAKQKTPGSADNTAKGRRTRSPHSTHEKSKRVRRKVKQ